MSDESEQLSNLADIHYGKSPNDVLAEDGPFPIIGTGGKYGAANEFMFDCPAVVVPRKGSLGNPQLLMGPFWPVDTTYAVVPKLGVDANWLYYNLLNYDLKKLNEATGVPSISRDWLNKIRFFNPQKGKKQKIGEILRRVDIAIQKTETLIDKYQQIKTGLMHDLFTRGVTADGKLRLPREQAPELYQESHIGWIPKEWGTISIESAKESLVDGPFGSNLKTEHYVVDLGVRVVRLQNIQATLYNDEDRAYVSERHANFLSRNIVLPGDILIAGLGEERYPVGRACVYPNHLPPAINKADCFRLRCKSELLDNAFAMYYLNTNRARRQVAKYEQGVTRPRINLGNLKRVIITKPEPDEQLAIVERLNIASKTVNSEEEKRGKLILQKLGLMHDLLTGKVCVKMDVAEEEVAHA